MNQTWSLGGRNYTQMLALPSSEGEDCGWYVVKSDTDGSRHLLQLWTPRPSDRDLDRLKHEFLQCFTEATRMELAESHFGFSERHAWFLQRVCGTTLESVWPELDTTQREDFLGDLARLTKNQPLRAWFPETIGLSSGRVFIPRALLTAPVTFDTFANQMRSATSVSNSAQPWLWEQSPILSDANSQFVRGRQQEVTYLKTLMYGLSAPLPMERLIIVQGEKGLGQETIGKWTGAAAESEGMWVTRMRVEPSDTASIVLGQLVSDLLQGQEAEFYAAYPEAARRLSRRVASFAFLRGGRRPTEEPTLLEPDEMAAAAKALAFAHARHPRLVQVLYLEHAATEVLDLLARLALETPVPWYFSYGTAHPLGTLKTFHGVLHADRHLAVVQLNRLEDADLRATMDDILGRHSLPDGVIQPMIQASLGNPSLLASILERAEQDGFLIWQNRSWTWKAGATPHTDIKEALASEILEGRIKRLKPQAAAIVRALALLDQPIALETLGRAVGLAGEPFEESMNAVLSVKLATQKDGQANLREGLRDVVLAQTSQGELKRSARSLLKAIEGAGRVPAVRLISLAMDEVTALTHVLQAIEQPPPSSAEAERVVQQTMALRPTPIQQARLWEYLSDAWSTSTTRDRVPPEGFGRRSPWELALEPLGKAWQALQDAKQDDPHGALLATRARLLQKRANLELRLHRLPEAHQTIHTLAALLAEHPMHPDQPLVRLLLGRLHVQEGFTNKGIKAFEEGLQLAGTPQQRAGRLDQVSLLHDLGRVLGQKAHFQRSQTLFMAAFRILEHDQDPGRQVQVLIAMAHLQTAIGIPDAAYDSLRQALNLARIQEDLNLSGACHLAVGIFRSCEESLETALSHLDKAYTCFQRLGATPAATRTALWKARTLAAMGDTVEGELLMLRSLAEARDHQRAQDAGDEALLQAEIAGYAGAWRDAARLYTQAAERFETAGLAWRERLARLRHIQAHAQSGNLEDSVGAWSQLESLKTLVEGSGSRWLEMEWHRAHGLLLGLLDPSETVASESLGAWNQTLALARQLRYHAVVISACVESAALLLARGERLGAVSRLQEAFTSFTMLWSHVPDTRSMNFLGRPDMQRFRKVTEMAGLPFNLPEKADPLADWTPTQTHSGLGSLRDSP